MTSHLQKLKKVTATLLLLVLFTGLGLILFPEQASATHDYYLRDTAAADGTCTASANSYEGMSDTNGSTNATRTLGSGNGHVWNLTPGALDIDAGTWSLSIYVDHNNGGGNRAINVTVARYNSSCVLQDTLISTSQSGTKGGLDQNLVFTATGVGTVNFAASDLLVVNIDPSTNNVYTLQYNNTGVYQSILTFPDEIVAPPTYTQNEFEWFVDEATVSLTDVWPVGTAATVSENGIIDNSFYLSPPSSGSKLRLQMNITIGTAALTNASQSFALQYVPSTSCSTVPDDEWISVGDVGSSLTGWGDNDSGIITYNSGGSDEGQDVALGSDGSLYATGFHTRNSVFDFTIRKYDQNGDIDTTWGTNNTGSISYNSGAGQYDEAYGIDVDDQDRVYVAGIYNKLVAPDFVIVSYDENGDPRTDYCGGFECRTNNGLDYALGIVLDDSNESYTSGFTSPGSDSDLFVRNYTDKGGLGSWGGSGVVQEDFGSVSTEERANNAALGSDGSLYVAGAKVGDGLILKIDPNGDVDTTWGTNNSGSVSPLISKDIYGVAVDSSDNAYAAGQGDDDEFQVLKYDVNGDLDTTWGTNNSGSISYDPFAGVHFASNIVLDSDRNIYVSGTEDLGETYLIVRKYDINGDLDTTWGDDDSGMVSYRTSGTWVEANSLVIDSSRNIYVVGTNADHMVILKYDRNGDLADGSGVDAVPWRLYDNTSLSNATAEVNQIASSDETGFYNETNPSSAIPDTALNADVEMDWPIQMTSGAKPNTTYCFRMTRSNGIALDGYSNYPQVRTSPQGDANQFLRHGKFFDDQGNLKGPFWLD